MKPTTDETNNRLLTMKSNDNKASNTPVPARPAATVILMRPADNGFEVLLLLRAKAVQFAGNTWVFPGGRIDQEDYGSKPGDEMVAAKVAAARESQEEANLALEPENFHFFSHWTTPVEEKKRFSTWFLLGCLHEHQDITVDDSEIVDHQWLSPEQALKKYRNGELQTLPPGFMTLLELSSYQTMADVIASVKGRELPHFFPNVVRKGNTPNLLLAGDAGYESGEVEHDGPQHRLVMTKTGWEYISPY